MYNIILWGRLILATRRIAAINLCPLEISEIK